MLEINAGLNDFFFPEVVNHLAQKLATRLQFSYNHYIRVHFLPSIRKRNSTLNNMLFRYKHKILFKLNED